MTARLAAGLLLGAAVAVLVRDHPRAALYAAGYLVAVVAAWSLLMFRHSRLRSRHAMNHGPATPGAPGDALPSPRTPTPGS